MCVCACVRTVHLNNYSLLILIVKHLQMRKSERNNLEKKWFSHTSRSTIATILLLSSSTFDCQVHNIPFACSWTVMMWRYCFQYKEVRCWIRDVNTNWISSILRNEWWDQVVNFESNNGIDGWLIHRMDDEWMQWIVYGRHIVDLMSRRDCWRESIFEMTKAFVEHDARVLSPVSKHPSSGQNTRTNFRSKRRNWKKQKLIGATLCLFQTNFEYLFSFIHRQNVFSFISFIPWKCIFPLTMARSVISRLEFI